MWVLGRFVLRYIYVGLLGLCLLSCQSNDEDENGAMRYDYHAFTDLVEFQGQYYCAFREGMSHEITDIPGRIRIMASMDGKDWQNAAIISSSKFDLRDPKFYITSNNQLMLTYGAIDTEIAQSTIRINTYYNYLRPLTTGLELARSSAKPIRFVDDNLRHVWLWHLERLGATAYGVAYNEMGAYLMQSINDTLFTKLCDLVIDDAATHRINEASIAFKGDTMCIVARTNMPNDEGVYAESVYPYDQWRWRRLGVTLGGPVLKIVGDQTYLGTRGERDVVLYRLNPASLELESLYHSDPSGDAGYPGLIMVDDEMWMSYYCSMASKHQQSRVFMARLKTDPIIQRLFPIDIMQISY